MVCISYLREEVSSCSVYLGACIRSEILEGTERAGALCICGAIFLYLVVSICCLGEEMSWCKL